MDTEANRNRSAHFSKMSVCFFFFLSDPFCNDDNPICPLSSVEKQSRSVVVWDNKVYVCTNLNVSFGVN